MTTLDILNGSASMQAFRRIRATTRGLIAAPWTPLASLCSRWKRRVAARVAPR